MASSSSSLVCRNVWHAKFLSQLPQIRNYVVPSFRRLPDHERDDAVQDALVHAFIMFVRLMSCDRAELVFPTVLARFAIRKVRAGRSAAGRQNSCDVTSRYAQRRRGFVVHRLDRHEPEHDCWMDAAIEDHRTPVIDQVWFRIDFPEWLSLLSDQKRMIALSLASGDSTKCAAQQFQMSAARISQLRRELHESWQRFHGELPATDSSELKPIGRSSRGRPRSNSNSGWPVQSALGKRLHDERIRV